MGNIIDINSSKKELCGWYRATAAELITQQGKNPYVRLSLQKIKANGKVDRKGFSHWFTVGIQDLVEVFKQCGVTDKGISNENLAKALEGDDEDLFNWYGFWYNMPFGGVYKNKETGKIAAEALMFIPCDEDTSVPKPEWAPTQRRLSEILANYERVADQPAEEQSATEEQSDDEKRAAYEEWLKTQQK